jgi:hypothetical protein
VDRGFYQYLTKYNNSNNKADKDNALNNFKAFIISINNIQKPEPLKNTEYFLILFSLLTYNNVIQVTTYLVD